MKDIRTEAIVLRRVNYGEADRILTLITPSGVVSAMARGVRKSKSKLAGAVEMFTLSDLNLHEGKGDLYTLTGAKMVRHYGGILRIYERMELAGSVMKAISRIDGVEAAEYFAILKQVLEELDVETAIGVVEAWFLIKYTNTMEGVNLYRDVSGEKLAAELRYDWNVAEKAFEVRPGGKYGADEIKMLRIMTTADLKTVKRVRTTDAVWKRVLETSRMISGV